MSDLESSELASSELSSEVASSVQESEDLAYEEAHIVSDSKEKKTGLTEDDKTAAKELFQDYDQGDGSVHAKALRKIVKELDLERPHEEVEEMVQGLDTKHKGHIKYKHFEKAAQQLYKAPQVGTFELFRFSTAFEKLLMAFGIFMALAHGALQPMMIVVWGDVIDDFGSGDVIESVKKSVVWFVIIGLASLVTGYFQVASFMHTAETQTHRIRQRYFRALLSQEMGWFDQQEIGAVTTRISGDILLMREGMGDKYAGQYQFLGMFLGGFVVGFYYSWKLTLVIMACFPLLVASGAVVGVVLANLATKGQTAYADAGAVALQTITSLRTVAAFGGELHEVDRYTKQLKKALANGVKKGHMAGVGLGFTMFVMFASYALAFWYGSKLIMDGEAEAGDVITCFFAVLIGSFALGQASPNIQAVNAARGAAVEVFDLIDRESQIDSLSDEGEKPKKFDPRIELTDVVFQYPDPKRITQVFSGFDLEIEAGDTVALVGESGCGKSTVIGLIQRLYDVNGGAVTVGGHDVKDLSVRWLREQIGVVSQEPVLFHGTIRENIALGTSKEVNDKEIIKSAKMANAHDFIMALDKQYDTVVGERGGQLSGGQKQRIAIARALIRKPKILLLDEATSALDRKSEKVVQDALDKAAEGRTTIVIAHRLSTVQNADKICVVAQGDLIEEGTHDELYDMDGVYTQLVDLQAVAGDEDEEYGSSETELSAASDEDDLTEQEQDVLKPDDGDLEAEKSPLVRTIKLNAPELPFIILGVFGSLIVGLTFPFYAIIFSEITSVMLVADKNNLKDDSAFWSLMFIVLGAGSFIGNYLQAAMFAISGERLTLRIRKMLFTAMLNQEVGWFDYTQNTSGVLTTKLASDAQAIQGVSAVRIGIFLQSIAALGGGIAIAMYFCWELALAVLATVPFMAVAAFCQIKALTGFSNEAKEAFEESGHVTAEALMSIRTVVGLGLEEKFMEQYGAKLAEPHSIGRRNAHISGFGFGFGEGVPMWVFGYAFYFGALFVEDGNCTFKDMFTALMAILFGAMMSGQASSIAPDASKAKIAAIDIYKIVDRAPLISSLTEDGKKKKLTGSVKFKSVGFTYPTRPHQQILNGIDLEITPGENVALVGDSGCGKSTLMQLLLRFYDADEGTVLLNGVDVRTLNIHDYRAQIGFVQQEPVLFDGSVADNIKYGCEEATMDDIIRAAKMANVHKFVMAMDQGYETSVGERGSKLSGGQKQRVAIARALVRDPKILLFDEATSALDSHSEKIVQAAIDNAAQGRTSITIAHRLSTIKNCDRILVIKEGQVVEEGDHDDLMDERGEYYHLVQKK